MKNTKRALLMSVLSMLLCIAMLAGSTFAWFTDTVTSGKNKIVAGNLDVELYYQRLDLSKPGSDTSEEGNDGSESTDPTDPYTEGGKYELVDEETNIFDEDALWEPGRVEVVYLKVVNKGTLALKYALGVLKADSEENVIGKRVLSAEEYKSELLKGKVTEGEYKPNDDETEYTKEIDLSKYLKYAVIDHKVELSELDSVDTLRKNLLDMADNAGSYLISEGIEVGGSGELLPYVEGKNDEYEEVTLVVYMPTDVGNEANYRLSPTDKMAYDKKTTDDERKKFLKENEYVPIINLGVNVFATQTPHESDSFNDQYDVNAPIKVVEDASELVAALSKGGVIEVPAKANLEMSGANTVEARTYVKTEEDKTTALNLGADSIIKFEYDSKNTADGAKNFAAMYVKGDGEFVVNADDSAAVDSDFYCFQVGSKDEGDNPTLVIDGGKYTGFSIVNVVSGKVIINGGTFDAGNTYEGGSYEKAQFLLNCIDASYKAKTASIEVKGGTFIGFNPANNEAEGAETNFVASGYEVVETQLEDGRIAYKVVKAG